MRLMALPIVASLILARDGFREAAPPAPPPIAEPEIAHAHEHDHEYEDEHVHEDEHVRVVLRETEAPVPGDVRVDTHEWHDGEKQVKVARRGQLVALRYEGARAA